MHRLKLQPPGSEPIEILIDRTDQLAREAYHFQRGDRHAEVEVETLAPWSGWLRLQGRVVPYFAARTGDTIEVWVQGRRHRLELVPMTARRAAATAEAAATNTLTAPMPGTILKIDVEPGDAFEAHRPLIVMESMKMEMTISSPSPGRVKDVLCKVGDMVEMGELLARLEPPDEA
ncbi:MAG: acetyl-CoA carboxylase biotin carboxyl carrier protein subunit [Phycisphaerae bacterium]|nr:acetyl-CoA carboxylase biotin carboxyl carrier protein subunit [Phycisphaerae bacterium]